MAVTNLYTVDSLAAQLSSEITGTTYTAGGTIPARLATMIRQAGSRLWNYQNWDFCRKKATLTISSGASTATLDSDFGKMVSQRLILSGGSLFHITNDSRRYQEYADNHSTSGVPKYGFLTHTDAGWILNISPEADKEYTASYWFDACDPFHEDPTLADNVTPPWPYAFDDGWYLLALYRGLRAWRADDTWRAVYQEFKEWLSQAVNNHQMGVTDEIEPIAPGYDDFDVLQNDISSPQGIWDGT